MDDRLIHGQVVVGWVRFLGIERIVVISDDLATDETQRMLLEMGVPETIDLALLGVSELAQSMKDERTIKKRTMLLAPSPKEYRRLVIDHGVSLDEINLGGQRYIDGSHRVCEGILLSQEAYDDVLRLNEAGVRIEVRTIPSAKKNDFFELYRPTQD